VRTKPSAIDRALLVAGIGVIGFLFAPIIVIVVYSFNTGRLLGAWEGAGLDAYQSALSNSAILDAVFVSLQAGALATLIATVLGTFLGIGIGMRRGVWTSIILGVIGLVLVTPEIVQAVSLLPWLTSLVIDGGIWPLENGILRLAIGHSLFATAVVSFLVRGRVRNLDPALAEAAADLYASQWNGFRQIMLPQLLPSIVAGALMAFTLSLDNTIISAFVQATGSTPWPVFVFSSIKAGLRPELAAMATVLLVGTLLVLTFVIVILRAGGSSSREVTRTFVG
jgi:ABC-type spermidine/putrescine transport system permease subunit II